MLNPSVGSQLSRWETCALMLDCRDVNRFGLQLAAASTAQVVEGPLSVQSSRIDLRETKFRIRDNDLKHKSSLPGSANLD